MTEPINVPSAGEPAYEGGITDQFIDETIGGIRGRPSQPYAKAMALELRRHRARISDPEWQKASVTSSIGPSGEPFSYAFRDAVDALIAERVKGSNGKS